MTKTLEELKEIAKKCLNMELGMMKELPSLSFQDTMYFISWYTNHSIRKEIAEVSKNITMLKRMPNTTTEQ